MTMIKRVFLFLLLTTPLCAADKKPVLVPLDDQSFAVISSKRGLYLDVRVDSPTRLERACRVYTGYLDDASFSYQKLEITPLSGKRALIPYLVLSQAFKRVFLQTMWPEDGLKGGEWHHRVRYPHETLWTIAQMYTGFGNNYKKLVRHNRMRGSGVSVGMLIRIPEPMLMALIRAEPDLSKTRPDDPVWAVQAELEEVSVAEADPEPVVSAPGERTQIPPREKPPAAAARKPEPEPTHLAEAELPENASPEIERQLRELAELRKQLRWGRDRKGAYAEYRLARGEAIYSAVVVRFCGLVRAADVHRVARQIIDRNEIHDVTDIAIGTAIRIPLDLLEPEFKPVDHPDYRELVANLEEVSKVSTEVLANNLEGVYLILDAGHGGRDPGADRDVVWEDDYVYDIICRVKDRIERETAATVLTTVLDPSVGYKVQNVSRFSRDHDEILLTSPHYKLSSRRVTTDGVNLRWMLANNRYQQLKAKGIRSENVIFASFHADALHPSIRGSMVYVPDARQFPNRVNVPNRNLRFYEEREGNSFSFDRRTMREAQARSMAFADNYIDASRRNGIRVHHHKPVRSLIYRDPRHPFVPAVLRFNRVPTRVLIEVCNLNNGKDRALLRDPDFRQRVAETFVNAVFRTYGLGTRTELSSMSAQPVSGDR